VTPRFFFLLQATRHTRPSPTNLIRLPAYIALFESWAQQGFFFKVSSLCTSVRTQNKRGLLAAGCSYPHFHYSFFSIKLQKSKKPPCFVRFLCVSLHPPLTRFVVLLPPSHSARCPDKIDAPHSHYILSFSPAFAPNRECGMHNGSVSVLPTLSPHLPASALTFL